jgi:hypothetical protein
LLVVGRAAPGCSSLVDARVVRASTRTECTEENAVERVGTVPARDERHVRREDEDGVPWYEQRDRIFDPMMTRYGLTKTAESAEVEASTTFAVRARLVGPLLDTTAVCRQRREKLNAQFDCLESLA